MNKYLIKTATALTLGFALMKVAGMISWGWLWVLSPLWIYGIVFVVLMIVAIVIQINEEQNSRARFIQRIKDEQKAHNLNNRKS